MKNATARTSARESAGEHGSSIVAGGVATRPDLPLGIVSIDPGLIDPSPLPDRFPDDDGRLYEALLDSVMENGQILPILLRPHDEDPERNVCVYGNRRLRIAAILGHKVEAMVRRLDYADAVLAQSLENSLRLEPSFIERASFARSLKAARFEREFIKNALSVGDAEASRMLKVALTIPDDIVKKIGRAPKIGRERWQALADALQPQPGASRINTMRRVLAATKRQGFADLHSDARFLAVLRAAQGAGGETGTSGAVKTSGGSGLVTYTFRDGVCRMTVARELAAFAEHLIERIPALFAAFSPPAAASDGKAS